MYEVGIHFSYFDHFAPTIGSTYLEWCFGVGTQIYSNENISLAHSNKYARRKYNIYIVPQL